MVMPVNVLDKFQITPEDVTAHTDSGLYDYLDQMRSDFFATKYEENIQHVAAIEKKHKESIEFLDNIAAQNKDAVREFLLNQNKGATVATLQSSRTFILIDATASMSNLLDKTKNRLETMFERVYEILASQNLDTNTFQIKMGVYRN